MLEAIAEFFAEIFFTILIWLILWPILMIVCSPFVLISAAVTALRTERTFLRALGDGYVNVSNFWKDFPS